MYPWLLVILFYCIQKHHCQLMKRFFFFFPDSGLSLELWQDGEGPGQHEMSDCLFYHIYRRTRCCFAVWVLFQKVACRWGERFRALQHGRLPSLFFSFLVTLNLWATSRARLSLICCYCISQRACGLIVHVWILAFKTGIMSIKSWNYCECNAELPPAFFQALVL